MTSQPLTLCLGCGRTHDSGIAETVPACPACATEAAAALSAPRDDRAELTAVYLADCAADALRRLAEDLDATDPERVTCLGVPEDVARASLLTSRDEARNALLALREALPRGTASWIAAGTACLLGDLYDAPSDSIGMIRRRCGSAEQNRKREARWRAYPDGMVDP